MVPLHLLITMLHVASIVSQRSLMGATSIAIFIHCGRTSYGLGDYHLPTHPAVAPPLSGLQFRRMHPGWFIWTQILGAHGRWERGDTMEGESVWMVVLACRSIGQIWRSLQGLRNRGPQL